MIPVPAECPRSPEVCVRRWKTVIPRFVSGAWEKKREMGSLKERRCCERSLRIAAAVNPLVIEPMLNLLERLSRLPPRGEYAFSSRTEVSLATSTTPEKPLSACARAIASRRAGLCAAMRTAGKRSSSRARRLPIRLLHEERRPVRASRINRSSLRTACLARPLLISVYCIAAP